MRRHETVSICFNQGVFLSQIPQVDPMMNCPCTPDLDLDEIGQVHQGFFSEKSIWVYGIKVCRHWFLLVGYWKGSKRTVSISKVAQILGPGLKDVGSHVVLMVWQRQMVEQQWLHAHRAHRLHWHHQSSRQSCLRIPPTTKGSGMVGRESPKKGLTWSFTDCRPFHLLPC